MNKFWLNPNIRRALLSRGIEIMLIAALIVGTVWLYRFVTEVRVQLDQQVATLEAEPEIITLASALKNELRVHDHDIQRIRALVPTREDIGSFVSGLERAAQRYGVTLQVPTIAEEQTQREGEPAVPVTGVYRPIRLHVVATGRASDLLAFLHDIEHMPSLVSLASWTLDTQSRIPVGFVSRPTTPTVPGSTQAALPPAAALEADLILQVWNEERSAQ